MPTSIVFTDAFGLATLTNGKPSPGDRFAAWAPRSRPHGESAPRQSDRRLTMFHLSDSYGAAFELRGIPVRTTGGVRPVDIADRLVYHLLNAGTCAVNTGDAEGNSYATCQLMPETEPELVLSDPQALEYTLSLSLLNVAAVPVPMKCHYAA